MIRPAKPRSKRPLSPQKLQQREAVFAVYRDMGPARSYERLIEMVRKKHGPVSRRTLVNWAREHSWRARLAEHDRRFAASPASPDELDPNFDRVEALSRLAYQALQLLLTARVVVRTPRDYKMMIDAAEKAIMLAEKLKQLGAGGKPAEQAEGTIRKFNALFAYAEMKLKQRFVAEGRPVANLADQVAARKGLPKPTQPSDTEDPSTVH